MQSNAESNKGEVMSDLKLYEVTCSVEFIVEVEAASENDSKELAKQQLIRNGIYDVAVSTGCINIEDVTEIN